MDVSLLIPDLWQQEAVRALRAGDDVVVNAPTGAGKTLIFELAQANLKGQAIYTVPTRALANDKLREWRLRGWKVGISTGDLAENLDAPIVVATLETQRSKFLSGKGPRFLVIDEYQMLADRQRGVTYELAIALSPVSTQLLLLSGSVGNPGDVVDWLTRLGRRAKLISTAVRPVPLDEVLLPSLPIRVPGGIRGHWPRLIAAALASDLGPLLVFSPRRAAAEELARALAAAIPCDDPLPLSTEQHQLAGDPLNKLLRHRIAYHHSGLSYALRAGLIEPLAKAGQLRVVVATTGLAAGVNFSMRSVLITDTRYLSGPFERHLQPEELLQMFGRAGRRGLDDIGYVLTTLDSPRINDGRPLKLTRSNQVDWPSLISVMQSTSETPPFQAAVTLSGILFSRQRVPLGVEESLADGPRGCGLWVDAERALFARPRVVEMLNSRGEYEPLPPRTQGTLGELRTHDEGRWISVLRLARTFAAFGEGQLCRIRTETGWHYGKETPLGSLLPSGVVALSRWLRTRLTTSQKQMEVEAFRTAIGEGNFAGNGVHAELIQRGNQFLLQLDFSQLPAQGYRDRYGRLLDDPPLRKVFPSVCVECPRLALCEHGSKALSPALAWRKMGLVEPDGKPTRRGLIFSFFQQGEGLAIAAALEDDTYAIEEIIFDLANLRAGHRFAREDEQFSGRLGSTCQRVFEHADYAGYLELGLPLNYGNGAAEVIRTLSREPGEKRRHLTELLRPGDIERAFLEWRSLLRQIRFAPDLAWERWRCLKQAAEAELKRLPEPHTHVPPLTAGQALRGHHRVFLR